jgi:hypothetical protein
VTTTRQIYCCGCVGNVKARLTSGAEIYAHRPDLAALPFWKCDACGNHVGCHHKTANRTEPLGCIPTPEIRKARSHIHAILDPLWKGKKKARGRVYGKLASKLGLKEYHTADIRSVEQARDVWRAVKEIANGR